MVHPFQTDAASGWPGAPEPEGWPAAGASPCSESAAQLEAELPEVLFHGLRQFLNHHPEWDQHRVATSALATFLFQNGCKDTCVNQHYFSALFLR
jgi:hypothetical protein